MKVNALAACHPECRFCAVEMFRWLAGRMTQMAKAKRGDTTSFAECAATSVKPEDNT